MVRANTVSRKVMLAVAAVGGLLTASSARAQLTPLPPGGPDITTPGAGGIVLSADTPVAPPLTLPFIGTNALSQVVFTGTLTSQVFSDPLTGGLDFTYQVTNTGGPDSMHTISLTSYSGYPTNIDYVTGSGQVTYDFVNRIAPLAGFSINADYSQPTSAIAPGLTTDIIIVQTPATSFDTNGITNVIDGGTARVESYEPAPIPEPASLSLLAVGAGALIGRRRRVA